MLRAAHSNRLRLGRASALSRQVIVNALRPMARQRTNALQRLRPGQHEGHAFKGKVSLCSRDMRLDLDVHDGVSFSDQWPMETGPPSLTLRRVNASGTAASEISINTQKASM